MLTLTRYVTRKFIAKPSRSIGLFGLNSSGKTSVLFRIKVLDNIAVSEVPIPTLGFNSYESKSNKYLYKFYDLGGSLNFRGLWHSYFQDVDGIIFVIDSSDKERFGEAVKELRNIIENKDCQYVPICIAANKQDIDGALEPCDYEDSFSLKNFMSDSHTYTTIATSIKTAQEAYGVQEILDWFTLQFDKDPNTANRVNWRAVRKTETDLEK